MNTAAVSRRVQVLSQTIAPLTRFLSESTWAKSEQHHRACDFTFGNPHEMPLALYVEVEALQKSSNPLLTDWFADKQSYRSVSVDRFCDGGLGS